MLGDSIEPVTRMPFAQGAVSELGRGGARPQRLISSERRQVLDVTISIYR